MDRAQERYEFGGYRLDVGDGRLLHHGEEVVLRRKVYELLVFLLRNSGRLVTNDRILKEVWGEKEDSDYKVTSTIAELRRALSRDGTSYIENRPGQGYRFVGMSEPGASSGDEPPVPGGAVPPGTRYYLVRETDEAFFAALRRRDSIVLVKGPPQVGKTSLLARGAQAAREEGSVVVSTHLLPIETAERANSATFLLRLAEEIAEEIAEKAGLESSPHETWKTFLSPAINFQRYLQRHVLERLSRPLVWVIDDVDELFHCEFRNEIFGMFRWWHTLRAMEPDGPWRRLTLALAYATEAHLFITSPDQSPFNVGTHVTLRDFHPAQVASLRRLYGEVLPTEEDLARYYELVGGHPYLTQRGLYEMQSRGLSLPALEAVADAEDGPFGGHLRRMRGMLERDAELCETLRGLLRGEARLTDTQFYRLRSAGVLAGESKEEARLRCRLYERSLKKHL